MIGKLSNYSETGDELRVASQFGLAKSQPE